MFNPRPGQKEVLDYKSGWMGIAAVPGSGKTHTLSRLASLLLLSANLEDEQEVLIVTLVNSAVDNFSSRIAAFMKENNLIPDLGYRVRTLHGLSHDIVRERPDLVGLSDRFVIVEERESIEIIRSIIWNRASLIFEISKPYLHPDYISRNDHWFREKWLEMISSTASNVIRFVKDLEITPVQMLELIQKFDLDDPLVILMHEIFSDYQRALNFRSAVDFDDLIRLALKAIKLDPDYLARLQHRWPYILEDEAQDSSRLQEIILRTLAGKGGNWVRVGDTNQAIFESFTTASPKYLRSFLDEDKVIKHDLFQSGRSTMSIIKLANHLIEWTRVNHPVDELRGSLTLPLIRPTDPGDPQPNPPDQPEAIFLSRSGGSPEEEVKKVIASIKSWLPDHPDKTIAILVPRNERGADVVEKLKAENIPYLELLKSSLHTRHTAKLLATILDYLSDPSSTVKLVDVYKKIHTTNINDEGSKYFNDQVQTIIKKFDNIERFLFSKSIDADFALIGDQSDLKIINSKLDKFRNQIIWWQNASLLPIDQLLLFISQDLFTESSDLALAQKLALSLERSSRIHLDWRLPDFSKELTIVANNERRFLGFSEDENGFNPELHKGVVVVATIHRAKGLEWDRVYLMSVNNYDFPSAQPDDTYLSEKYFVRDHLNLEAEILSSIRALADRDLSNLYVEEGTASRKARLEYCSERLRLLYVGITRARRELIITWNTGKTERVKCRPSLPFTALRAYWENENASSK